MIRMLARFQVANFADFAAGYRLAEHASMRADGGVRADSIQHLADDPTTALVIHDFDDLATAQSYAASAGLHKAMQADGVLGSPDIEFFEVFESTS